MDESAPEISQISNLRRGDLDGSSPVFIEETRHHHTPGFLGTWVPVILSAAKSLTLAYLSPPLAAKRTSVQQTNTKSNLKITVSGDLRVWATSCKWLAIAGQQKNQSQIISNAKRTTLSKTHVAAIVRVVLGEVHQLHQPFIHIVQEQQLVTCLVLPALNSPFCSMGSSIFDWSPHVRHRPRPKMTRPKVPQRPASEGLHLGLRSGGDRCEGKEALFDHIGRRATDGATRPWRHFASHAQPPPASPASGRAIFRVFSSAT